MNLLRAFNHMRYLILLLAVSGHAAGTIGDQDIQRGVHYTSTFTASVLQQDIVKSCSYGTTTDSNGGFNGCAPGVTYSTYAYLAADVSLGAVSGVCYASATLSGSFPGGTVLASLQAWAHMSTSAEKPKTAVLVDGAFPPPWSTFTGSQQGIGGMYDNATDMFVGFGMVPILNLSAGAHEFCIAAWREPGSAATLHCGNGAAQMPNCVLSIVTIK